MRRAGYAAPGRGGGFSAGLQRAGYSAKELRQAGYTTEIAAAVFSVEQPRHASFKSEVLKGAGFKVQETRRQGPAVESS